jgi:predicted permease
MSNLWQDIVIAARLLRKTPAFSIAAVLTLALGVGVNTAVFSVLNAVLLRPLPVRDGARLVVLARQGLPGEALRGVSAPDLAPYRSVTAKFLDDVAGYDVGFLTLSPQPADAHRVLVTWVTGNYFPLLDVKPALGRLFVADDVVAGRISPIVVLGYSTWQKRFGGDRSVIGRHVMINGRSCTIVGVAPQAFRGTFAFTDSELYLPLTWAQGWPKLAAQHALARLRAGATIGQAQASIDIVAQRLAKDDPDNYSDARITVIPERLARPEEEEARWNTLASTITFGLVALVLAIAAVNVTNLLLARGGDRRRELAIRAALGASRGRLVRQLLTEALLLAAVGGIAGTVIARWTGMALSNIRLPGDKPIHLDFHLDIRVLVYAAAVALITGLAVGLWPAFHSSRPDVNRVLRDGGRRSASGSSARRRARGILIVAQIAGCFVLLVAAGLFTRSLSEAERINLGFRAAGVLNVGMDVQQLAYDEQRGRDFFDQLERRVRDLPAVNDVAFAANVPLGYIRMSEFIDVEGQPRATGQRPLSGVNWVSPSYFKTMGIRIVDGRSLEVEEARPVAVVNQRFADVAWPGERAIGRRFSTRGPDGPWIEVIGVTETGKYDFVFEDPQPYVYYPLEQWATGAELRTLHVLTSLPPEQLIPTVERVIKDLEPELALFDVMSMERALGGGFGFFLVRTAAMFAGILGLLAVSLAVVGLYGVVSYAVGQRTHEIGVRMALGAARRDIARMVLGNGAVLVASGIVVGFGLALLVTRFIAGLLFGVSARDPMTFVSVVPILAAVSIVACGIPAWRASRVEPAIALRDE